MFRDALPVGAAPLQRDGAVRSSPAAVSVAARGEANSAFAASVRPQVRHRCHQVMLVAQQLHPASALPALRNFSVNGTVSIEKQMSKMAPRPSSEIFHKEIENRCSIECYQLTDDQAPYNRETQRPAHFGSGAETQR
jgi:hypothetical protein